MATGRPEGGGKGQSSSLKSGSLQGLTAAKANSQGLLQRMANEAVRGQNERQLASVHSELNARTLNMQHTMDQQKFLTQGRGGGEEGIPGSGRVLEQEEEHRQAAKMFMDIYNNDFRVRPFVQDGANDGDTQTIAKQSAVTGQRFRTPEEVQKDKQEALDWATQPVGKHGAPPATGKHGAEPEPVSDSSPTPGPSGAVSDSSPTPGPSGAVRASSQLGQWVRSTATNAAAAYKERIQPVPLSPDERIQGAEPRRESTPRQPGGRRAQFNVRVPTSLANVAAAYRERIQPVPLSPDES